jgi:hypothetical protein
MPHHLLERDDVVGVRLVKLNGEGRAKRVHVRDHVRTRGNLLDGFPDHLVGTLRASNRPRATVRDQVVLRRLPNPGRLRASDLLVLRRQRLGLDLPALLRELDQAVFEVNVVNPHTREGAPTRAEIDCGRQAQVLLPRLAAIQHAAHVGGCDAHDLHVFRARPARPAKLERDMFGCVSALPEVFRKDLHEADSARECGRRRINPPIEKPFVVSESDLIHERIADIVSESVEFSPVSVERTGAPATSRQLAEK